MKCLLTLSVSILTINLWSCEMSMILLPFSQRNLRPISFTTLLLLLLLSRN